MSLQIDLFDASKVRPEVKRLSACFDAIANVLTKDSYAVAGNIVEEGLGLYKSTTGSAPPAELNEDEASYLRFAFLRVATKIAQPPSGWEGATEKTAYSFRELEQAYKSYKTSFYSRI